MDCQICCEKTNKSTRVPVNCNYCEYSICRTCFQRYLLESSIDPHCMNCKKIFTRDFLSSNCTSVFITKTYKTHRENVLLDREKCMLPATQPYVVIEKEREKIHLEIRKIEIYKNELQNIIHESNEQIRGLYTQSRNLNVENVNTSVTEAKKFVRKCPMTECRGFLSSRWKCGTCETNICNKCNERKETDTEHICDPANVETMELLNKDTKPCPSCGTMISKISGCFEENTEILTWDGSIKLIQDISVGDTLVGDDGNKRIVQDIVSGFDKLYEVQQTNGIHYTVNSKHTLLLKKINYGDEIFEIITEDFNKLKDKNQYYGFKSDNSTISLINVVEKPEGKYFGFLLDENHRFVHKDLTVLKNCDQMWCPDCQTAFSWNRGTIETGVVHNPHYYEFQRRRNGGVAPRNAGDIPCGGVPDAYMFRNRLRSIRLNEIKSTKLTSVMQVINHIQHVEMRNHRQEDNHLINRNLRVQYLLNKISEDNLKQTLQQNEKSLQKKRDFSNIYQMFCDVASDIFRQIMTQACFTEIYIDEQLIILHNLIEYFNENLKSVGKVYKCVYPGITKEYSWVNNYETYLKKLPINKE